MKTSGKMHYAWWIFIACCFISAGGFALVFDIVGIYLDTVSESLSIDMGALTLWLGIESLVEFFVMPFAGKLFTTKRINLFIALAALLVAGGTLGFSLCTEFWQFVICGALIGCGMPFLFGLPQTTLIGNWFGEKHQGRMLSIAMSCEGVFAMIWAPLFMFFLQEFGWQTTYVINAVLIAVMILPWALFVIKRAPQDVGLEPYGVGEGDAGSDAEESDTTVGTTVRRALTSPAFWLTLVAACLTTFGMGFMDYQPVIASDFLVPHVMDQMSAEMFGATMISVFSAGSLIGTLVFGFFLDKIGLKPTFALYLAMFALSFVLWGFVGSSTYALLVGAFLLGTHNGLASVGFPLLVRRLFGGLRYPQIYSYINMVVSLVGGFTASIIGTFYDATGSIEMAILVIGLGISAVIVVATVVAILFVGKIPWESSPSGEMPLVEEDAIS